MAKQPFEIGHITIGKHTYIQTGQTQRKEGY
jgi:hypothetical protein